MDIGWYKENKALQAELRREYPAVAELIAELENKLAYKQEQCDQLAHEVIELERECREARKNDRISFAYLSEVRSALHFDGDFPSLVDYCKQLSRYQGAVEVEGKVYYSGDYCWVESDIFPDGYELPNGRRVTLLVMKEV